MRTTSERQAPEQPGHLGSRHELEERLVVAEEAVLYAGERSFVFLASMTAGSIRARPRATALRPAPTSEGVLDPLPPYE